MTAETISMINMIGKILFAVFVLMLILLNTSKNNVVVNVSVVFIYIIPAVCFIFAFYFGSILLFVLAVMLILLYAFCASF